VSSHWFKRRDPSRGVGYDVASPAGWITLLVVVAALLLSFYLPGLLPLGPSWRLAISLMLVLAVVLGLVWIIHQRSDWRG
jgi:hypothetical protein